MTPTTVPQHRRQRYATYARPMKRSAAGVLFYDRHGRILLVQPTYKPYWDLPGGHVEAGESPKTAAERECKEELGININVGDLLIVDWLPGNDQVSEAYMFVFDGGTLPTADPRPDHVEIWSYNWFTLPQAAIQMKEAPLLCSRVHRAVEALWRGRPAYLESARPVQGQIFPPNFPGVR